MSSYSFCGQKIVSNITISELSPLDRDQTGLVFNLEGIRQQSPEYCWSYHRLSFSGETLLSYSKQEDCHWLRFPRVADFQMAAEAKEIFCYPMPDIAEETIRHLLLDQVLPRCLAHQGRIMLHASAVRLQEGVLLFLGDSGAGKSTLAGNFHQAGIPAVSDDCVWIKESAEHIEAVPSYGGLRLWEDSLQVLFGAEQETHSMAHYSTKKRVPLHQQDRQIGRGVPVLAVIVLSPAGQTSTSEVILEPLSRREAFIAMLRQTFQLDLSDLERMSRHVSALGRIVPQLPAYGLAMPRDYDLLPLARQKILDTVL